jgi:protein-disulfide isomerase
MRAMHRTRFAVVSALLVVACEKGSGGLSAEDRQKLDAVVARVDAVDKRVAKIEALIPPEALDPRPEPDPNAVYSVPIAGDPSVGPEHAKVTIVEAFEFA